MLEFGARILLAGAIILLAGTTGAMGFTFALGVAIAVCVLALAGYALASRGLYDGAGAGLHTSLEGFGVALLLVDAGKADSLGFLVLVPYAWAAARHRAPWAPGAFAAAFALVGAYAILYRSDPPTALLIQAGCALILGLFLAAPGMIEIPIAEAPVVDEASELRGRFRALREAYNVLEQRSKDDAHTVALVRATSPEAMAQCLRDATSSEGAAIFAPSDEGWDLVGSAGSIPNEFREPIHNARDIQEKGATLIFAAGRPVGAVWTPTETREGLAGMTDALSGKLSDRLEAEIERRRRHAAELRVTLVEGGDSPDEVAYALAGTIGADSVEFGVVGPLGATALGRFGPPCGLPDAMRHETGAGLSGWASAGGPLVWIGDARSDTRLDGKEALRARAATLALVPLADGRAYVWAAWHTAGAGRPNALSTMRAAEPVVVRWLVKSTGRAITTSTGERIAA